MITIKGERTSTLTHMLLLLKSPVTGAKVLVLLGDLGLFIRCSKCDETPGRNVSVFRRSTVPAPVHCLCGQPLAKMTWSQGKRLILTVYCQICGKPHQMMYILGTLMRGIVSTLYCPNTTVELGFIGGGPSVSDVALAWQQELASVPAAMHNRIVPRSRARLSLAVLGFLHCFRGLRAGARLSTKGNVTRPIGFLIPDTTVPDLP